MIYFFKVSPWKCHETLEGQNPSDSTVKECVLTTNHCVKNKGPLGTVMRNCGAGIKNDCQDVCVEGEVAAVATGKVCTCCKEACNSAHFTRGFMGLNALVSISLTIIFSLM